MASKTKIPITGFSLIGDLEPSRIHMYMGNLAIQARLCLLRGDMCLRQGDHNGALREYDVGRHCARIYRELAELIDINLS